MATDTSKQCTITNKSGRDIMVALAVTADETTGSNTVVTANRQLEVLKTADGATVIKNNASGTITLDHSYTDGNEYVPDYNLQVCDSAWAYPVTSLLVAQQRENGTTGFTPQTITATDGVMSSAVNFYQTIAACPNSGLAKNYIAALQQAQEEALTQADGSPGSTKAISDAIADRMSQFFKSTEAYKNLTLADVVAVGNYYNNFPAVWAQYQDNMTYYLYGSDGETAVFAGTLSLQKSSAFDVTKPAGGYTCSFLPAVDPTDMDNTAVDASNAVTLTYAEGLFVDDPKADVPKIGLRGSFLLKKFLTNNADDTNVITLVAGTINGSTIVGLDTAQHSTEAVAQTMMATESIHDAFIKYWDGLLDPKSLQDWAVTILTFVAAVAVIPATAFAVYRVYKLVTYKPPAKVPTRQEVQDHLNEPVEDVKEQGIQWLGNEEAAIAEYYNISIETMTEIAANGALAQALAGGFGLQRIYMKELLPYSTLLGKDGIRDLNALLDKISASEKAATKIVDETVYKDPGSLPGRIEQLKLEMNNLGEYSQRFDVLFKKVKTKISADARETVEEFSAQVFSLATDLQRELDKNEEEETDLEPKVDEEIKPTEL